MDRRERAALDRYLTREPPEPEYEEEERERTCPDCRAPLAPEPDRTEAWEDSYECDGKITETTDHYSAETDAGILDIIGWEYEGKEYTVTLGSACGATDDHAPHRVTMAAGMTLVWVCRGCGAEIAESLM